MSTIIECYYKEAGINPFLLKKKMEKLHQNEDILSEFEYWIEHNQYLQNGVSVEGYTAQSLAKMSEFIDGEAAFMLLIELREAPEKALHRINDGFQLK